MNPRTSPVTRLPALVVLGQLRARRGDPDATTPLTLAGEIASSAQEIQRTAPLVDALAESAHLNGELASVVASLRDALAHCLTNCDPWIRGGLAIWLWRAREISALPDGCSEPYRLEAAGQWREAAAAWNRLGCPYEHACMLAWYGDEPAQREALERFEALGATPAAQQLRRRMRAGGTRGVPRGSRASTRQNAFGLTKREAQVLELMRSGLRNAAIAKRLYLSTRTIDHHVSSVLAKLGASTRAEAVAIAAREAVSSG
jgi:DNA-binding CsgD family transcriptional regulator